MNLGPFFIIFKYYVNEQIIAPKRKTFPFWFDCFGWCLRVWGSEVFSRRKNERQNTMVSLAIWTHRPTNWLLFLSSVCANPSLFAIDSLVHFKYPILSSKPIIGLNIFQSFQARKKMLCAAAMRFHFPLALPPANDCRCVSVSVCLVFVLLGVSMFFFQSEMDNEKLRKNVF